MPDLDPLYLDHNASTPLVPEALAALTRALVEGFANPTSTHVYGKRARALVDEARQQVAALVGAHPHEIVFTSGCTESNNLAIRGASLAPHAAVVSTSIEHPATTGALGALDAARVKIVDVDASGRVKVDHIERALDAGAGLVTIIHAHNETGVVQPVREIATLARARGFLVHTDAAQSVGKIPVDVDELGVHLLSIAGHKLGAPKGVGALYVRRGVPLAPLVRGASHESGRRPGTENIGSIAALGAACDVVKRTLAVEEPRQRALRDRLQTRLLEGVAGAAVVGDIDHRLPNTLFIRFPRVSGTTLLAACPSVAASTGSACHEGDGEAPSVRLSLGRTTTAEDVDRAATALIDAWHRIAR